MSKVIIPSETELAERKLFVACHHSSPFLYFVSRHTYHVLRIACCILRVSLTLRLLDFLLPPITNRFPREDGSVALFGLLQQK